MFVPALLIVQSSSEELWVSGGMSSSSSSPFSITAFGASAERAGTLGARPPSGVGEGTPAPSFSHAVQFGRLWSVAPHFEQMCLNGQFVGLAQGLPSFHA